MKVLLEEAHKMLKTLGRPEERGAPSGTSLSDLQRQLDELKGKSGSLRAFRLTKICTADDNALALLDSGATHPLRALRPDDVKSFQRVKVALADGHKVDMLVTPTGVMVSVGQQRSALCLLGLGMQGPLDNEWPQGP